MDRHRTAGSLIAESMLAGCGTLGGWEDPGSASYTVAYEDVRGAEVITEVAVPMLDCWEAGEVRYCDPSVPDGPLASRS